MSNPTCKRFRGKHKQQLKHPKTSESNSWHSTTTTTQPFCLEWGLAARGVAPKIRRPPAEGTVREGIDSAWMQSLHTQPSQKCVILQIPISARFAET